MRPGSIVIQRFCERDRGRRVAHAARYRKPIEQTFDGEIACDPCSPSHVVAPTRHKLLDRSETRDWPDRACCNPPFSDAASLVAKPPRSGESVEPNSHLGKLQRSQQGGEVSLMIAGFNYSTSVLLSGGVWNGHVTTANRRRDSRKRAKLRGPLMPKLPPVRYAIGNSADLQRCRGQV